MDQTSENRKIWDYEWRDWVRNHQGFNDKDNPNFHLKDTNKNTRYRRGKWVLDRMKTHDIKTVLDAGCGLGWHSEYFEQQGYKVEGRDVSPKGIEVASQTVSNVVFKTEDINEMTDENKFDAVLALSVLICIQDVNDAISRLYRATKKYLYLTFELFNSDKTHVQKFNIKRIGELLEGYNVTAHEEDGEYYYVEITK